MILNKTYSEDNQYLIEVFPVLNISKYRISINTDYTVRNQKHRLLKKELILSMINQEDEKTIFNWDIFVIGRFIIDPEYDGYLIEEIPDVNAKHKIYCLLFDKKNRYFIQIIELASYYYYEGSSGEKECYIYDLNDDNYLDLIITGYSQSIIPGRIINNKRTEDDIIFSSENRILFFVQNRFRDFYGYIPMND